MAARHCSDVADALFAEAGAALDWVKRLILDEGIECDFEETGRIQLAYTPEHFACQRRLAKEANEKGGLPCEVLSRDRVKQDIATPFYYGGLLFSNHGALHPAKFLLGLLEAALRRGISVLSHCPALKVIPERGGHRINTLRGIISAKKVVLATNGYTGVQFPWFNRRVFPLPSYLVATEPLPPDLIADLAPGRRMMVETRAFHSYFRISPDGTRILFGGRAAMVDIGLPKAARRLHQRMVEIWPRLKDVRLSHVWTGANGVYFPAYASCQGAGRHALCHGLFRRRHGSGALVGAQSRVAGTRRCRR